MMLATRLRRTSTRAISESGESDSAALLSIQYRLRRGSAQFKLCAHFLNLRGLFFHHCCKGLDFLLLLCDGRLEVFALLLHFAVLFQKLVKQHRVHLVVAHSPGFSFRVQGYQGGIHLFNVFSNQPPLLRVGVVVLIMEGYWLKRIDRLTSRAHEVNVFLEPRRGDTYTKLAESVNRYGATERAATDNAADVALRVTGSGGRNAAYVNHIRLPVAPNGPNIDVAAAARGRLTAARISTHGDIMRAGSAIGKRSHSEGRVVIASGVGIERIVTNSRIPTVVTLLKRTGTNGGAEI